MDLTFLIRGIAVGFTVAAPVGPMSLLTIRRTLAHGRGYGLVCGLGIALADASYGGIAAFGLTAVAGVLVGARLALGLLGGTFLVWLGIRTMLARPSDIALADDRPGLAAALLSSYALTMTNPMTILSFGVIFAGLGLTGGSVAEAAMLTVGVFVGSFLWWIGLTAIVGGVRTRITTRALAWVNRVSGAALLGFGALAVGIALGWV